MKRFNEQNLVDYTIASNLVSLEDIRSKLEEVAYRVKAVKRFNKKHSKFIEKKFPRDKTAGQNSLTTPVNSGK